MLPRSRLGEHIARQLVRSGTAPAANYAEGCAAESRNDFAHKLGIALKELREAAMWLRLVGRAEWLPEARLAELRDETDQLCRILARSITTARKNASLPEQR